MISGKFYVGKRLPFHMRDVTLLVSETDGFRNRRQDRKCVGNLQGNYAEEQRKLISK
jgi:hypothetical protein